MQTNEETDKWAPRLEKVATSLFIDSSLMMVVKKHIGRKRSEHRHNY